MSSSGEERSLTDIEMLDRLINQHYRELSGEAKDNEIKNVKIGDLIKMIETRRKLAPGDGDQKEFWKMLDQIRRDRSTDLKNNKTTRPNERQKKRNRSSSVGSKACEK